MKSDINHIPTARKILIVFVFLILGMGLIGMRSEILVNESIMPNLIILSILISLALIVIALFNYFTHSRHANMPLVPKKPAYVVLSVVTGLPLLTYLSVTQGLPPILHYFTSKQGSMTVTISTLPSSFYNKRCSGRVYLEGYSYFLNDHLCGINKTIWNTLTPGDNLILIGQLSPYGFTYNQYKKANKSLSWIGADAAPPS